MAHQVSMEASSGGNSREASCSPLLRKDQAYDYVIVGFGPSALSTAIALHEENTSSNILILERKYKFDWKPAAFLPTNHMRTSFLQDLATQRNPRSDYTFTNYSFEAGGRGGLHQMEAWLNLGSMHPSREIWGRYLAWAAQKLGAAKGVTIKYGTEVGSLRPVVQGSVESWTLQTRSLNTRSSENITAHKIVVAVGERAKVPQELRPAGMEDRIFHTDAYPRFAATLAQKQNQSLNVAVIGSNNEAVEAFMHLHSALPNATGTLFVNDRVLRPTDESPL